MELAVKHTDKVGSVLWLLLAAGIFVASEGLPAGTGETGPEFYPRVIAVLIALFALFQLGRSLYEDEATAHTITDQEVKTVGTMAALVTIYVLSLPWLGFVTGTVVFLVVGMLYSGARSAPRIGGVAVLVSVTLYYMFAVFLRIPLPESPFVPVESLLPGLLQVGHGVIY